jgi:hypothetical protein
VLCAGGKSCQKGCISGDILQPCNPLEQAREEQRTEEATMPTALRMQKALEALAPGSNWIVMDPGSQLDAVACARRLNWHI